MNQEEKSRLKLVRVLLYLALIVGVSISFYPEIMLNGFVSSIIPLILTLVISILVIEGGIRLFIELLEKKGYFK